MTDPTSAEHRVQFDFEATFTNEGGIQGQGFRLDIEGDDIADEELAALIVGDLRLLMVKELRIRNKQVIRERHKRPRDAEHASVAENSRIDLSHVVEQGMTTYPGLPTPEISAHLTREQSRSRYAPGTEFHIGMITMCGNTGTYVDSPFHRYATGSDLAGLPLDRLADLDAVRIDVSGSTTRPIDRHQLLPYRVGNRAVLIHTGWSAKWRTDAYFDGHPFLTDDAAQHLVEAGAVLVGIDSLNVDDTSGGSRPVHSTLLAAGVPICEHLTNLGALPVDGFRFSAVPVKVAGLGTFPVRAYATVPSRRAP